MGTCHRTLVDYPFESFGRIVGSCNRIVCVYENERRGIHLWNPSNRRKLTLRGGLPPWGVGLAHGFGFIDDDYKILWTSKAGTFVYTMKTHAWREIASPASPFSYYHVNSRQCLFNGALHWVVVGDCYHYYIMRFDLSSEVFSTIELPDPSRETSAVTIIEGCVAVICSYNRIWMMREYNETGASWSLADTHERELATRGYLLISRYSPRGIPVYNPNEIEVPWRLVGMNDSSYIFDIITGIESLGLLDMGTSLELAKRSGRLRWWLEWVRVIMGQFKKRLFLIGSERPDFSWTLQWVSGS